MSLSPTRAVASPNIALIKYWGDCDSSLHIPANGSISMNLAGLYSHTSVSFIPSLIEDQFFLDGKPTSGMMLVRVANMLNRVRTLAGISTFARVESQNSFPSSVGIASSASGFAALALAASRSAGIELDEISLSRLARTGSGSACRSIPGGFVEWLAGTDDTSSFAYSFASPVHWDLADCIVIISRDRKAISSSEGHTLARTSLLQDIRISDTPRRLDLCRSAILDRDFGKLAEVVELDSNLMHAVMMTSAPPLYYWQAATMTVMQSVQSWRKAGLSVCFSVDAGPNVHVLCPGEDVLQIATRLGELPGVLEVLIAHPGGPAMLEGV
jgi:diphosphomevalonate decarboxylase